MPKRVGYLYEKFLTLDNFVYAEYLVGKNKPDNKMARHIMAHKEEYGKKLFSKYSSGDFHFHESRVKVIIDSYKNKQRTLRIPCLEDQAVQIAWLNIATPYLVNHNYYYNCGSIPKAGQTRCVNAIKGWLRNKKNKYASVTDIRKFYDNIPHSAVIAGLERIFKDEKFIQVAKDILASMSNNGIGLAIGHPTSHWFANIALCHMDNEMKRMFPNVKTTRYMDDIALVSPNKRQLRKAVQWLKTKTEALGLTLKKWFCFVISHRGISFLSYRFFTKFTILQKRLMYRISRKFKRAKNKINIHVAQGLISYLGILKHCNSFNFRKRWIYPSVNPKHLKRMISNYEKNLLRKQTCGT